MVWRDWNRVPFRQRDASWRDVTQCDASRLVAKSCDKTRHNVPLHNVMTWRNMMLHNVATWRNVTNRDAAWTSKCRRTLHITSASVCVTDTGASYTNNFLVWGKMMIRNWWQSLNPPHTHISLFSTLSNTHTQTHSLSLHTHNPATFTAPLSITYTISYCLSLLHTLSKYHFSYLPTHYPISHLVPQTDTHTRTHFLSHSLSGENRSHQNMKLSAFDTKCSGSCILQNWPCRSSPTFSFQ